MRDKQFLKQFLPLYIVLVLQNVISLAVNLADNVMVGGYSEQALAGAAAVNQVQFIFGQILLAFGEGTVIICSQYWGKKQIQPMKKIAVTAMHGALIVAAALTLLTSVCPQQILSIFTDEQAIIAEGLRYLQVIRFTYLIFAVTTILLATLRSVGSVRIAFYLSVMTLVINCCINYTLIYGRFGAPELGVTGAAIGTLAARVLELLTLIVYIAKNEKVYCLRIKDYMRQDFALGADYLKICFPMLLVQGLWGVNTALQTVVLGHMASSAIAANSMAQSLFMLVKSMAVGAASAAAILIGRGIGEGDYQKTRRYAGQLQQAFVVIGLVSGTLLYFIRIPVLGLYHLSDDTRAMANHFLMVLSVVCVGMSYQMPTNNGIIRGGGNAFFGVKLDLISIWLIVLPVSFFMAFVAHASPLVVICCLNADQIFKCVPAFLEVRYGNWMRKLTRDG